MGAPQTEYSLYENIIHSRAKPRAKAYAEGVQAHKDGKAFHEHANMDEGVEALSWRMGWNDAALDCVDTALLDKATVLTMFINKI